jgi:ammonium transporter
MPGVDGLDIAWLLVCAALVLFMQAGFTALESGLVRSKNSVNVAIKNFASFLVSASLFWLFGFAFMFGPDRGGVIGTSWFAFDSRSAFLTAFFVFQLGFIATSTTLISGAVAERMRFAGYIVLAVFVAAVTYPVFGHWAWGGAGPTASGGEGWLRKLGFVDYAGSTVVHSIGGWTALAAIIVLGPRIGRFGERAVPIRGHDLPLTTVGVFVLWVGWYGFNGGSLYGLTPRVPSVILNTTLAAAFGGLVGLALTWLRDERPDVVMIMNGALAGLVGITASANIVSPWEAVVIGSVAGLCMFGASLLLERLLIDDAVGAVPVHLAAGVWGTLAVALLGDVHAFPTGAGRLEQAGIQLVGIATCFAWAFGIGFVLMWLVNRLSPLRVDREGELAGLNVAEHGASTELADLLSDMDEQRRSGDFAKPVRVEPHTEVGQIAVEYNRVLAAIGRRTDSLQLLQRTAAAANESSSVEDALSVALEEVCNLMRWPVGHALLVSRDEPIRLIPTGVWRLDDEQRYTVLLQAEPPGVNSLPGLALAAGRPVLGSSGDPPSVAVPILAGSTVVGVLEFLASEPIDADPELLELLMSVGTQLGRIVERQRSEEARLLGLIDNMPALVYLRDLSGRFILANKQYEDFWGFPRENIRGKTLSEINSLVQMSMKPELNIGIDREVLNAGEPFRRETRILRDGTEHVFTDVRFPVRDDGGTIVAIAGIDIDVTAQKRYEAELAELLRRVEVARDAAMQAASAKSRFLANMSHELRTPLNAIMGFTRLVSRNAGALPEQQVDNLSKILVSAERLLALIDEILDLSRVEAGELNLDLAETDVAAMLREAADSIEPLVERSRVSLRLDTGSDLPVIVTDREKLRQIILNLLSNAINYTDDGAIEVLASASDGRLRIEVADTGVGIASGELRKIFDEFHRSVGSATRTRPGTGLGLTISLRLARALGGDLTVESQLGAGSTFSLELPLRGRGSS